MRKEIWSIYNNKYFEVLKFYTKINSTYSRPVCPLKSLAISAGLKLALPLQLFLSRRSH